MCGFLPSFLAIVSALWVLVPNYVSILFTCVCSTQIWAKKKRAHICAQRELAYMCYKRTCVNGHSRSSYMRHQIIPSAINLLQASAWPQSFHVRYHGRGSLFVDGNTSTNISSVDSPTVAKTRRKV